MPDVDFIIAKDHKHFQADYMPEIYKDCSIGLRFTSHDGQSTTVAEMGLMGRRVIHNGLAPNCIPWRSVDNIVNTIKHEQKRIGIIDRELSQQVREFLDIGEDWLETEFYGGVKNENSSLCKIQP